MNKAKYIISIFLLLIVIVVVYVSNSKSSPEPMTSFLRDLANDRGLFIGVAVRADKLMDDTDYSKVVSSQFNMITPENDMKFVRIHPKQNEYSFDAADSIVDFAEKNDMEVRGHTLIWHRQLPDWIEESEWTKEQLTNVMREHIATVVDRYKGRVSYWDVVNEPFDENGILKNTVWMENIGQDFIQLAFEWAHEADPDTKLFLNEAGASVAGPKFDGLYAFVSGLKEKGVPIDGVGMQMHMRLDIPDLEAYYPEVETNIKKLNDLGLDVQITELDVAIDKPVTSEKLQHQAEVYQEVLDICLHADSCTAFVTWGFTDQYSWIPKELSGYNSGLILDKDYQPKPAYDSLMKLLSQGET